MATTISTKDHIGNGTLIKFDFNFPPIKTEDVKVALNGATLATTKYTFPTATEIQFNALGGSPSTLETNTQESNGAPKANLIVRVQQIAAAEEWGNYQFIKIKDIINNFLISYVGENKLISKISRTDVAFHAQRGLAEMSYDTFRSEKSQEIEVPPSLTMILPHDYVNYV